MNLESLKFKILKSSTFLKPTLIIVILLGVPFGIWQGYSATERIWANLGYINGDHFEKDFDSIFFETTKDLGYSKLRLDSLKERVSNDSESWPISLLTSLVFENVTNSGEIHYNDSSFINYDYEDELIFNDSTEKFSRKFFIRLDEDARLPEFYNLVKGEIEGTRLITPDSLYTMYIEAWTDTDSVMVRFYER